MARTKKGSKGPGYEYWSRRSNKYRSPGKWSKKMTHRVERRKGKRQTRQHD